MERPPDAAGASSPTITGGEALARDPTGRAHDPATGRFIRAGRPGPRIEARRAQVARLYPEKTCAEIGAELGWATPTIWQDVKALGLKRRRPGARRKHPEPEARPCAGCGVPFTPPSWAPDQRFHSIPCARATPTERVRETARALMVAKRQRVDTEIARLNEAGYVTSRQLAAERKVTESAVSRWISIGVLAAERRLIEGEPHQVIARRDLDRFVAEDWPRMLVRMGPGWPSNWSSDRMRVWDGKVAKKTAARRGKRVGRSSEAAPWAGRIDALRAQRLSERAIARIIGISDSAVHRYLAATRETASKPPSAGV